METNLLEFIEYHKIDKNDIMDAKGLSISEIKDEMKMNDILFAYNTTPCGNAGHTIRDRHSHCIVCNTANIAFMKRTKQTGHVYIAGSIIKNYIKIGMTTEDPIKRIGKLNSRKVGNTNDWVVIKSIKCDYANMVEFGIQKELQRYKVEGEYYGDNDTESSEMFRCRYKTAIETVEKYFSDKEINKKEEKTYLVNPEKYNNFKNIANPKYL
ncbi:GIY-YIG nuclease family protein [Chryseobacterium oranimense]|uniref:GIY-YIG nuclease family protein n=1 Tax=Chryseobacterium oranimense TaxID=421058 RepID=UPI0022365664|nr:GIY-YIG nuclease family protein [Chryseobacterium oranimense]